MSQKETKEKDWKESLFTARVRISVEAMEIVKKRKGKKSAAGFVDSLIKLSEQRKLF